MNYKLKNNKEANQYQIQIDEYSARIEYILAQDKIFLTHTEVPKQMVGKGVGSVLVKMILQDIEKHDLTLVPLCPFVAMYIKRHPEWLKLVMKGINIK
jgi:predicted GNAT family acetyltransferase